MPTPQQLWARAVQQYPILGGLSVPIVNSPDANSNGALLESWPIGETGTPDYPRPSGIPADKFGVQIFDQDLKPRDLAADVVSHDLVYSDPRLKDQYQRFADTFKSPEGQARLKEDYEYARKNEGETRPMEQWAEQVRIPAYFRGYAFQQWPQGFLDHAYSPEQRDILDHMQGVISGAPVPENPPVPTQRPEGQQPMNLLDIFRKQPQSNMLTLPTNPSMGQIATGSNGQNYQYAETTGMAGADGPNGWIRTNMEKPSLLDRYNNFTQSDRGRALGDFFTGLAMGSTPQESLGFGAKLVAAGRADRRGQEKSRQQLNQTVQWLQSQGIDPQEAGLIAAQPKVLAEYLKQQFAPKPDDRTSAIKDYQFAKQQGFNGSFADWEQQNRGGTTINLPGAPTIGTIPQGYAAKQDPKTGEWSMQPITGGPADTAKVEAAQAASKSTKSDVITDAYKVASDLIGGNTTGLVGQGLGHIPPSQAAELRRQVDVLKANATIENLNAMRQQSKTGGALGNVTEGEGRMLASAAGALDPNASPSQFRAALDNYYHTLLRIVNGPEAGDALFQQMKEAPKVSFEPDSMAAKADDAWRQRQIENARKAVEAGSDKAAVRQVLQKAGFSTDGIPWLQ